MSESLTRKKILDVASELFYLQGYGATGVNQVIKEADIAKASLYSHFPTKRDLLLAYFKRTEELWFSDLKAFVSTARSPKSKVLALFDYRVVRLDKLHSGCPFVRIGLEVQHSDPAISKLVMHQKKKFKEYIVLLLADLRLPEEGKMNKQMLAEAIFLLIEGSAVSATIDKSTDPVKKARKIAEKLL